MAIFYCTKTYNHSVGLSCAFRQWRADSHCKFIHGYALKFKFTFVAKGLDDNNWVMDFGGLKTLKAALEHWFDHTLVIAEDDPSKITFQAMSNVGLCQVRFLPSTGCESFARHAFVLAHKSLPQLSEGRVKLMSCECSEHEGNSATYEVPV